MAKKILFYTMTMHSGGAERVIANLANEFAKEYDVSITTLFDSKTYYKLDDRISISSPRNRKDTLINRIKNIKHIYKTTKLINPDVIIAFCPTMCFIACFLRIVSKSFRKIKIIISERNDPNNEYKNRAIKLIANYLYSKSDIIVFQNNGAKAFFDKKIRKKGVIIPNPINEKFIRIKNLARHREKTIVNVGRLEPQKNQELLIRACAKVFKEKPEWKLKIYGEGSLEPKLRALIAQLKMKNKIYLLGRCNTLENELPSNSIFVLSSNYEGMPNALMEAMACGLTCISTDCPCGGPKELIKDRENGYLVKVNDLDGLVSAILEATDNPLRAKQNFLSVYNPQAVYNRWRELIV